MLRLLKRISCPSSILKLQLRSAWPGWRKKLRKERSPLMIRKKPEFLPLIPHRSDSGWWEIDGSKANRAMLFLTVNPERSGLDWVDGFARVIAANDFRCTP